MAATDSHGADRWEAIHFASVTAHPRRERATRRVVAITVVTMVAELVAGYATGSMALVADGWHMASHALAMGLAWIVHVAARSAFMRRRMSFGTGKLSALGGYTSALFLGAIALSAASQSVNRLVTPVPVNFLPAIVVAAVGLVVNVVCVRILEDDEHDRHAGDADPNHRAAVAHVIADALTSILAVIALVCGRTLGWTFLDPVMGIAGSMLVIFWAARLIRTTGRTLLDFTPPSGVEARVRELIAHHYDAVVVDVHVWEFAPRKLACALSIAAHEPVEPSAVRSTLEELSDLAHVTVEVNQCRETH